MCPMDCGVGHARNRRTVLPGVDFRSSQNRNALNEWPGHFGSHSRTDSLAERKPARARHLTKRDGGNGPMTTYSHTLVLSDDEANMLEAALKVMNGGQVMPVIF